MRKSIISVLVFCLTLGFILPLQAQEVDMKAEIMAFDLSTMPQYADSLSEERGRIDMQIIQDRAKEREVGAKPWNNSGSSSDSTSTGSGGYDYHDVNLDGETIVLGCAIAAVIIGTLAVLFSIATDENIVFN